MRKILGFLALVMVASCSGRCDWDRDNDDLEVEVDHDGIEVDH